MKLTFCAACGSTEGLEHHHILPRSEGGGDEDTNMVTLCFGCHGRVHSVVRKDISALTIAGLQRARARGVKLGGDRGATLSTEAKAKGVEAVKARAESRATDLAPILAELRAAGATSLRSLAAGLNQTGIAPPRGATWSPMAVSRILARIEARA